MENNKCCHRQSKQWDIQFVNHKPNNKINYFGQISLGHHSVKLCGKKSDTIFNVGNYMRF